LKVGFRSSGTELGRKTHHGGIEAAVFMFAPFWKAVCHTIVKMNGVNTEILRSTEFKA
jgi:hypothetical protein